MSELINTSKSVQGGLLAQVFFCTADLPMDQMIKKQSNEGTQVKIFRILDFSICPVSAVWKFLMDENGCGLSKFQFISVFRKCLVAASCDSRCYVSHSFGIGAATKAVQWSLDEEAERHIRKRECDSFKSYIRPHLMTN